MRRGFLSSQFSARRYRSCRDVGLCWQENGIQHKRGYLFYGVPGSGKTSSFDSI